MLKTIPTIEEAGVPGYEVGSWFGVAGPAGMPALVIARLSDAINKALKDPEVRQVLGREGAEPLGGSPEEFATTVDTDIKKWTTVLKAAKIEPQ
jgi:tripartite-type tricarboxylate transporter receptor subunit TctC